MVNHVKSFSLVVVNRSIKSLASISLWFESNLVPLQLLRSIVFCWFQAIGKANMLMLSFSPSRSFSFPFFWLIKSIRIDIQFASSSSFLFSVPLSLLLGEHIHIWLLVYIELICDDARRRLKVIIQIENPSIGRILSIDPISRHAMLSITLTGLANTIVGVCLSSFSSLEWSI